MLEGPRADQASDKAKGDGQGEQTHGSHPGQLPMPHSLHLLVVVYLTDAVH